MAPLGRNVLVDGWPCRTGHGRVRADAATARFVRDHVASTTRASRRSCGCASAERRRSGLFVAEGPREVERARAAGLADRRDLLRARALLEWAPRASEVSERVLAKMAYRAEPEGVLAVVEAPRARAAARTARSTSSRSGSRSPATSARWRARPRRPAPTRSLVAEARADPWNPNAIRASTGAVFTLPVVEATLDDVARARRCSSSPPSSARRRATPTPTSRGPTAIVVGAEDEGLDATLARRRRPRGLDPAARPQRRQPERGDRRRGPALRGGAPAWLDRDDVLRARDDDRRPPRRARRCSLAHARRAPQVRALPAHRLVQAARRAQQAELARRRREKRAA